MSRWREIARFELRAQVREFLTWIYGLVFLALTFAYGTSDAVDLIGQGLTIPKQSPWAIAMVIAGVTAFGQLITALVAATAALRDTVTGQHELIATLPLTPREYLAGRLAAVGATMVLVYATIPVGLWLGAVRAGEAIAWTGYATAVTWIAVPNVLLVSSLFFCMGALTRRFMPILFLGVALLALWTSGLAAVRADQKWGAILDPFGNAAIEWSTRTWSLADKAQTSLPLSYELLLNRAVWLSLAATTLGATFRTFRLNLLASPPQQNLRHAPANVGVLGRSAWAVQWWWHLRQTLSERGFVTLGALAAANAGLNAWRVVRGPDGNASAVLAAIGTHARPFFILVATIYAGELVWHDRDVRASELRDALPVSTASLVTSRVGGMLVALCVLTLPLVLLGAGFAFWSSASLGVALLAAWQVLREVWLFASLVMVFSLALHAFVQNKVAGHFTLIALWVFMIVLGRAVTLPPWFRLSSIWAMPNEQPLWAIAAYWLALACLAIALTITSWARGAPLRRYER